MDITNLAISTKVLGGVDELWIVSCTRRSIEMASLLTLERRFRMANSFSRFSSSAALVTGGGGVGSGVVTGAGSGVGVGAATGAGIGGSDLI